MKIKLLLAVATILLVAACKNKPAPGSQKAAGHAAQMAETYPTPKAEIKTVGILLYDNYAVLDAMGPYHVFSELMGAKVFFIGRHKGLISTGNMNVKCDTSVNDVKQLDILVIPGGLNETFALTRDTALLNWIRAIDRNSKYTTSVCTGAWILAATGLLKGHEATTHWFGKKILQDQFGITAKDARYVHSGKYWTSAGVSAGIDMSLAVIDDIRGEKYTQAVMLDLEYDPQPPVKGGSVKNTDPAIVQEMRGMYDSAIAPVLHPESVGLKAKIDNLNDPVCGMALRGAYADTAHYQGKVYGFCSSRCKASFQQNPRGYLKQ